MTGSVIDHWKVMALIWAAIPIINGLVFCKVPIASLIEEGGTALYALLALAGDAGCSGGPTLVGFVSDIASENLKMGILAGAIFPVLLVVSILLLRIVRENRKD